MEAEGSGFLMEIIVKGIFIIGALDDDGYEALLA